jgi:hypothetical protein
MPTTSAPEIRRPIPARAAPGIWIFFLAAKDAIRKVKPLDIPLVLTLVNPFIGSFGSQYQSRLEDCGSRDRSGRGLSHE